MKAPWHHVRPELLDQLRADVEAFCPTLHTFVEDATVVVRGTFPVRHEGEDLDRYSIEIELPADYPERLPIVREVGGRIPWDADRHVYISGTACVLLPEDRWWTFPPDRPFSEYLAVPLHNYFLGQSVVEAGGVWPFSEHRHGLNGVLDFYKARFDTDDHKAVIKLLQLVARGGFKGHWPCPCGGGRRLRDCHWRGVLDVSRQMPRWAAQQSLDGMLVMAERVAKPKAPLGQMNATATTPGP